MCIRDSCGVKYVSEEHTQHLLQTIQTYYQCLIKKEGECCCGLTIKWDYPGRKVHLLMPRYIENALKHFQHPPPIVPQHQLHPHIEKTYGAKVQHATSPDDSTPLNKRGKKFIQEVTGVFLFLTRAVDTTMLTPLSALIPNKQHQLKKRCKNVFNFWTTQHHRTKPLSPTVQAT